MFADALGVTDPVPETAAAFHGRPFLVIHAERFAEAAERAIADDAVRQLPKRVGSVNQWSDATDVLERPTLMQRLRAAFDQAGQAGESPVLLTSGFSDAARAADGRFDILRKPFELAALERAIEAALNNGNGRRRGAQAS